MNGKQTAVLWMGLILVALNVLTGQVWKDIKSALFSGPPSGSSGGKGKSPVPTLPGIPGIPTTPLSPIIPGTPISSPTPGSKAVPA